MDVKGFLTKKVWAVGTFQVTMWMAIAAAIVVLVILYSLLKK